MKIVLATGIYPPDIGGPATYTRQLAEHLTREGISVTVITYGEKSNVTDHRSHAHDIGAQLDWPIVVVSRTGGTLLRWMRYRAALKRYAADADIVYAFSSISCGIPLLLAKLKGPKKALRLGGDFFWERATDRGDTRTLKQWYKLGGCRKLARWIMQKILRQFNVIVYSTEFQKNIYEQAYPKLAAGTVIENALPVQSIAPKKHERHDPLRLLFLGRFVRFKNLDNVLKALTKIPGVRLTLIGSGPMEKHLRKMVTELLLTERVMFLPPVHGKKKTDMFSEYDLLILPSLTEISPNTALEARAAGLPVLLTEETGLSSAMTRGMQKSILLQPIDIVRAISNITTHYDSLAQEAIEPLQARSWERVAHEHREEFLSLTRE